MSRLSTKQRRAARRRRPLRRSVFHFGVGTLTINGVEIGQVKSIDFPIAFEHAETLLPRRATYTGTFHLRRLMLPDENGEPALLITDYLALRKN